jgi:hypothetical protein
MASSVFGARRGKDPSNCLYEDLLIAFQSAGLKAQLKFGKWRPQSFVTLCCAANLPSGALLWL